MRFPCFMSLLGLAGLMMGCSENSTTGTPPPTLSSDTATKLPEPPAPAVIDLKPIKYAEFEKLVGQKKGGIVVVDFWSETCVNCQKGLPYLTEIQKKHANNGLTVFTVNMDDPDRHERILAFLKSSQIALPNYAYDATDEGWRNGLKELNLPHVRIYDRDGALVHDGLAFHDEVEKKVDELLMR